jgi:hypothetical protein
MTAPIRKTESEKATVRYEDDPYGWSKEQAMLLRAGRLSEIDAVNIAEEIEDVARSEYHRLESALTILLMHMLKWDHQPAFRGRGWVNTLREQRRRVERQLRENPSLKPALDKAILEAYEDARDLASTETNLDISEFQKTCPYDFEEIMNRVFEWPAQRGA